MAKLLRIFRVAFMGLVVGYIPALGLTKWIWLDMRLNVALSLPICVAAGILLGLSGQSLRGARFVLILEGLLLTTLVILYGSDPGALLIIPAVLFREGFKLAVLSLPQLNVLLLVICFIGNALWLLQPQKTKEREENNGQFG